MRMIIPNPALHLPARFRRGAAALWRETDGGWYGPRGACGCCCKCPPVFTENFTRADSSDLGSDWDEVRSGAEIVSNELKFTGTNVFIMHESGLYPDVFPKRITIRFKGASGDIVRILWKWTTPSGAGSYAACTIGASGAISIGTHTNANSVTAAVSASAATSAATWYRLSVCQGNTGEDDSIGLVKLILTDDGGSHIRTLYFNESYSAGSSEANWGLSGTSAGGDIRIDDFVVTQVQDEDNLPACCEDCSLGECNFCVDGLPYAWDFTVPVLVDNNCTDCATYGNQTYRVYFCGWSTNGCVWRRSYVGTCGSYTMRPHVKINPVLGVDKIFAQLQYVTSGSGTDSHCHQGSYPIGAANFPSWRADFTGCDDSYSLTYDGSISNQTCDASGGASASLVPVFA